MAPLDDLAMLLAVRAPPAPPPAADRASRASNAAMILGASGVMTGLTVAIVAVRLYVRQFVLKTFGWDDAVILLATMQCIAVMACFIGQTQNGGGNHWWDIEVPYEYERLKHWQYAQVAVSITGVSVTKISIGFGMLRFLHGRVWRWLNIALMVFVVVATIVCMGPFFFECWPTHYSWAYKRPPGVCIDLALFRAFANANAYINIITDWAFVLLPIPTIWHLQVNLRTKLSLIAVLSLGVVACAAAINRVMTGLKPFEVNDSPW
jgi:hypothetical protein